MAKPRKIVLEIESNRVTCGNCGYLSKQGTKETCGAWHCWLFGEFLGWIGAMKTPNRPRVCTEAEEQWMTLNK